jgi:hypothetical protein
MGDVTVTVDSGHPDGPVQVRGGAAELTGSDFVSILDPVGYEPAQGIGPAFAVDGGQYLLVPVDRIVGVEGDSQRLDGFRGGDDADD